jgi:hypothetical protein
MELQLLPGNPNHLFSSQNYHPVRHSETACLKAGRSFPIVPFRKSDFGFPREPKTTNALIQRRSS